MLRWATLSVVLIASSACNEKATRGSAAQRGSAGSGGVASPALEHGAAVSSAATLPTAGPVLQHGLSWYRDEPAAALAAARKSRRPLLVDLWAPWCHTCLSMQEYVLTKAKLPRIDEAFVFLAIDTEREKNAEFLQRYPVGVWPTFYVLDADTGNVAGRWLGAASPSQFARFLQDSQRAASSARITTPDGGAASGDDPLVHVVVGDALAAKKEFTQAANAYLRALEQAPQGWSRRPDVLVAAASALVKAKSFSECVDLALTSLGDAGNGVSAADFASLSVTCADALPSSEPRAPRLRLAAEGKLRAICEADNSELTADDRGDACGTLYALRLELGDGAGARSAALTRLGVLEAAARGVPDEVALTYDFARSDTLFALGRADEAIELLKRREQALPDNYNPPHYLARLYNKLERWDEGLRAIERALAKAYGPRKASLMTLKVDLLLGSGRAEDARRTLREQLSNYRALPAGQRQPAAEAKVEQRLSELR